MNFLRIEQSYAKIGIETTKPQYMAESRQSRLKLEQTHAKIEIDKQEPRVIIDQHECFATAGLKNDYERAVEAAQDAKQQVMEYIAKNAADGDMLASIESGGNPIAEIAERDSYNQHEFNIDLIPKARPRIEVSGGDIHFNLNEGQVKSQVEEGFLNTRFTEGSIRKYLLQKPSIRINFVGNNIDKYV